ncbi:receptor-like protein 43 [Neltuma alba]|uniref:receptor-like protein 43 n=1 Tax=Neltuma alba TaxID=207710 RepID=UPI0010A2B71C|nr:receptor-like protein 43 [Prosopis alba]
MGLCENTILFILICSLTSSLNLLCKCKAFDQVLCIPSKRQALLNFKQHLHGPSNSLATWSDDNTNCCNWTSVSCNHETGTQLQSFEALSFVGNDLCGPPLQKNCDDLQNIPNRHNDKEGKRNGVNWFYVSMSLGFVP